MDQALRVQVPILFSGEAPAIKQHDAIIMRAREALEVECLPGDMPSEIVVSIESLAEIDDAIYVRDLPLPPNVKSVIDDDELVVRALAPTVSREEAGEEAAEATPAAEAGESAGTTPSETAAGA
jgi:large subunit ribosomal protein L25